MPTSATGRAEARESGFTLVELLIVLTIVGLMSAAVVIAMPDQRGSLVSEAERFAARANAAQERAVMDARPMAVRVTDAGYGFDRRERGEWQALNAKPFADYSWSEGTRAAVGQQGIARIVFDTTGTAEPLRLLLVREEEQVLVEIGHDGRIDVAES